jgi:hypothetical protein
MFSGGLGSWGAARRAISEYGVDNVTLLFADTLIEDQDLYRFLDEATASLGVPLTRIADGRTPWDVFRDVRFIGNTRIDPCSRILKRDLMRSWVEQHCSPEDATVIMGIDWTEIHRLDRARPRWEPWRLRAPLCEPPFIDKADLLSELRRVGIRPPRLYEMGFPHNNCGGFCVKAGQAQFKLLLERLPERYAAHEREEEALRDRSASGVAAYEAEHGEITGQATKTVPLTLRRFRERLGIDPADYTEDWGGCGCAID